MPELPEITVLARDMRQELVGKTITDVEVLQPKCLNVPPEEFRSALSEVNLQQNSIQCVVFLRPLRGNTTKHRGFCRLPQSCAECAE